MCTLIMVLLIGLLWKPLKRLLYGPEQRKAHDKPECPFSFLFGRKDTTAAATAAVLPQAAAEAGLGWEEQYLGGSIESEAAFIEQAMSDIHKVQENNKAANNASCIFRAFHAKIQAGIRNAELVVADDIPQALQVGFLQPGKKYSTCVRFSNANGGIKSDKGRDLRGIALRVDTGDGASHDMLATNGKVSHARNAIQFIAFALAVSGSKLLLPFRLIWSVGLFEAVRMLRTAGGQTARQIESLATETYFSRSAFAFGSRAVKFQLTPRSTAKVSVEQTDEFLRDDLVERLKHGPVVFDLQVQYFINETETPIEDASVEWNSPLFTIAQLVIPQQDLNEQASVAAHQVVEDFEFNPWNVGKWFRPLGSLNRARRSVYPASVGLRKGQVKAGETSGCPFGFRND